MYPVSSLGYNNPTISAQLFRPEHSRGEPRHPNCLRSAKTVGACLSRGSSSPIIRPARPLHKKSRSLRGPTRHPSPLFFLPLCVIIVSKHSYITPLRLPAPIITHINRRQLTPSLHGNQFNTHGTPSECSSHGR